jgi:hypothetical protein
MKMQKNLKSKRMNKVQKIKTNLHHIEVQKEATKEAIRMTEEEIMSTEETEIGMAKKIITNIVVVMIIEMKEMIETIEMTEMTEMTEMITIIIKEDNNEKEMQNVFLPIYPLELV